MTRMFGILLLGLATPLWAQPPLGATRTALERWIEARQLISKTSADWQADRELLEQTVALYERELQSLAMQRGEVSTNTAQVDIERAAALKQQAGLEAASAKVRELAAALEKRAAALAPSFPAPLADKVRPLLARFPADPAAERPTGLERMRNVVGLINEVNRFNAAVTVISQVKKNPAGAEVQVETIYLGLAQAFFVDKAGEYAGVGAPGANGWEWTPRPELAGRVQRALAIYRNTAPAAFVGLPVTLQ